MVCKAQRRCGQPFARQQFLPVVDVNVDFRVRKKGLQRFLGQFWAAAAALPAAAAAAPAAAAAVSACDDDHI